MPETLQLPPVAQAVAAITAIALAIVRLLTASKPFWAWEKVPVWVQKALPALLMAVAALPTAIEHARNPLDIVVGFMVTGGMWFMASRGDKRSPIDKDGGPRIDRVNSDPKPSDWVDLTPPSLPGVKLAGLAFLVLVGCSGNRQPAKAPCDAATLAAITAECSVEAYSCGAAGVPKDECAPMIACNQKLDDRKEECTK